jgi:hypothetical protein
MDDKELYAGSNALTSELAKGIKKSKLFLSCVTKDYCKSYNCNLEVEFKNPDLPVFHDKAFDFFVMSSFENFLMYE